MPRKLPPQPQAKLNINTQMVHGMFYNDQKNTGAIHPPIYLGTTFLRDDNYEKPDERGYIRDDNPTHDQVAAMVNRLECGYETLIYPSGSSAMNAVFSALSAGDCAVVQHSLYFGLPKLLDGHFQRFGIKIVYVEAGNQAAIDQALLTHRPKILWIETPSNPLIIVTDIAHCAKMAHQVGAKLVVDNTAASPALTQPINLGADIVLNSATKYLNGHTDVLSGTLTCKIEDEFWISIRELRFLSGAVPGSLDMYLLARGIKTLFMRMRVHCENAAALALYLENHPKIERVLHPSLPSHPQHNIAKKQMQGGFGGLMSVLIKGNQDQTLQVVKNMQLIRRATSLGGIESKAEHRYTVEGAEYSTSPQNLIRFSVGCESIEDIIHDWEQALAR